MKHLTKVIFFAWGERITTYFEGKPDKWQIAAHLGNVDVEQIIPIQSKVTPHYVKSKTSLSGYTTNN